MTLKNSIKEILIGIDKDECSDDNGWWITSTGADFGAKKQQEILELLELSEVKALIDECIDLHEGNYLGGNFSVDIYKLKEYLK